jgi:hypothetical protein
MSLRYFVGILTFILWRRTFFFLEPFFMYLDLFDSFFDSTIIMWGDPSIHTVTRQFAYLHCYIIFIN